MLWIGHETAEVPVTCLHRAARHFPNPVRDEGDGKCDNSRHDGRPEKGNGSEERQRGRNKHARDKSGSGIALLAALHGSAAAMRGNGDVRHTDRRNRFEKDASTKTARTGAPHAARTRFTSSRIMTRWPRAASAVETTPQQQANSAINWRGRPLVTGIRSVVTRAMAINDAPQSTRAGCPWTCRCAQSGPRARCPAAEGE